MFEPVSGIRYRFLNPDAQVLVCMLLGSKDRSWVVEKWQERAAAAFEFDPLDDIVDVVRDLLANPQIRALVFDGHGEAPREVFTHFWAGHEMPDLGGIPREHVDLVRRYVDLYDVDCGVRSLPPYSPKRLVYKKLDS